MTIRSATPQDIPAIYALRFEVFVDEQHVPPEEELDALDATACHYVAEENGEIIGCARLLVEGDSPHTHAHIGRLAVRKSCRGRGIGAAICRYIIRECCARGCEMIWLNAQTQALGFYKKLGFNAMGEIFLDAGIQHKRMEMILTAADAPDRSPIVMDAHRIILAAHRGDRKCYPENTLPAFRSALVAGCDMIETDLHMTADGELILMHDRNAKRTTGVDRFVTDMTLAEVKALDAGTLFSPNFSGEPVPTVRELMELIRDTDMMVNWELKDFPHEVGDAHAFACADKLIALIEAYGLETRSMLNSFSDRVLEYIYRKHGHRFPLHGQGIYRCRRTKDIAEVPQETLYDWCCMYANERMGGFNCLSSLENFAYCTERGIKPCVCIPDTVENYRIAIEHGCRMFTSNDIYAGDAALRALGIR